MVVGETGAGWGDEIGICRSVGPGPIRACEIVVGMPLGVETPGRPPRIPPVPGKLMNEPPPAPGARARGASCSNREAPARWCRPWGPAPRLGPPSDQTKNDDQKKPWQIGDRSLIPR